MEEYTELQINEFGEISLDVEIAPVSLQASRSRKDALKEAIQELTNKITSIYTDDVSIEIEWFIHEQKRYETDKSSDVDNIIKPILDSLCGLKGILIDDCQVQSVNSHWIDWTSDSEKLSIKCKSLIPGSQIEKDGLLFVQMFQALCFPINLRGVPNEFSIKLVETLEKMINGRNEFMSMGVGYYEAKVLLPQQRVYHVSRVQEFKTVKVDELKEELKAK